MLPFFGSHEIKLLRVLTDRGGEYCGNPERHEYELYLWRSRKSTTPAPRPRARTRMAFVSASTKLCSTSLSDRVPQKLYRSIDELQVDLDLWVRDYNEQRPHQGRRCFGKTPMQTFLDAIPMAKEKSIAA